VAHPRVPAQSKPGGEDLAGQASRAPGGRHDQAREALGEDPAATAAHLTHKAADLQVDDHPITSEREISEQPRVPRMDARGAVSAQRTPRYVAGSGDGKVERRPLAPDAVDPHTGKVMKDELGEHGKATSLQAYDLPAP
jgi:hypothetical protein